MEQGKEGEAKWDEDGTCRGGRNWGSKAGDWPG